MKKETSNKLIIMFCKLQYFAKSSDGICAADFRNKRKVDNINLSLMSSVSDMQPFTKPLSEIYVSDYALVKMNNGDTYYIDEDSFRNLTSKINEL